MTERRLERLKASGKHGTQAEREAAEREDVVLQRIHEGLEAGTPIRDGSRRGRGEGDPRVPLPDPEARAGTAERRRGGSREVPRPRGVDRWGLSPRARPRRRALGPDRDGARRARARRGSELHGGARHQRVEPGPGHRAVVPAAGARLVPDRRSRRGARLADPGRIHGSRRCRCHPHRPRQGLHPSRDRGLRGPAQARLDGRSEEGRTAALGGRPTGSRTGTCSRSCSAAEAATQFVRLRSSRSSSARIVR